MRTRDSIPWQVVRLDWRLLFSACRAAGPDRTLPILLGAVLFAAFCESAVTTASVLAGQPGGFIAPVLAVFVWNTCLAVTVLTIAVGAHSTAERILHHLAQEPITRWQLYTALAMLSLAGRHALISGLALVPVICLLAGLVDPVRATGAGVAMLLVLYLVPGVTRFIVTVAGAQARTLALMCGAIAAMALLAGPGFDEVIAALPPSLVIQYAAGFRTPLSLWLGLAAWTLAVGLLQYLVLSRQPAPMKLPRAAATLRAIPAWIRGAARLAGIAAPLLHGELVRLMRWHRFLLGWGVYFAVLAVVIVRATLLESRVLPTLVVALLPPFVASSTLGNLFAPDRAGIQAFFLSLDEPRSAVRAKVTAVAVFVAAAEVVTLCLLLAFVPKQWKLADVYTPMMAVAFYVWSSSVGRTTSTLFPAATDPRAVGGGLLKGAGAALLLPLNGLALAGIVAPALSYDTGRIGLVGLLWAGCGIAAFVIVAALLASRVSNRLMSTRREELIVTLGLGSSLL
jgi:hypothetical protein